MEESKRKGANFITTIYYEAHWNPTLQAKHLCIVKIPNMGVDCSKSEIEIKGA